MVSITPQLRQLVIDKVKQCKAMAVDQLKLDMPPIQVKFDLKGLTSGQALVNLATKEAWIRFNPEFVAKNTYDMINTTIPHEMAHIVANLYYGAYVGHDIRWIHIMKSVYGFLNVERCHNYERPDNARKMKRYSITCIRCLKTSRMNARTFNKVIRMGQGASVLKCPYCGNRLNGGEKIILQTAK